jgi:hypothetical protein
MAMGMRWDFVIGVFFTTPASYARWTACQTDFSAATPRRAGKSARNYFNMQTQTAIIALE